VENDTPRLTGGGNCDRGRYQNYRGGELKRRERLEENLAKVASLENVLTVSGKPHPSKK